MFTIDDFEGRVGDTFTATAAGGRTLTLTLTDADSYQGSRTRFSLVFSDTVPDPVPQQIVSFEHPELGSFELFVVPIGPGPDGMRYEAIINT
jgi:hypothetical protein